MSTPSISDKGPRRRTDSGELDVFEAERYFSAATEILSHITTTKSRQLGRSSLDMPRITQNNIVLDHNNIKQQHNKLEKKKQQHKLQPNSPGGKLASFFNSLINQTVSKSNKKKSVKDIADDDSPSSWRRRRRNSITTTLTTNSSSTTTRTSKTTMSDIDTKSIQSCSNLVSGFRTPPPYTINNPIKPYKEFKNATAQKPNLDWLDHKFRIVNSLSKDKRVNLVDRNTETEEDNRGFKSFMEEDGADSDSSSDLFELQLNYDHHHHHQHLHLHHQLGYCAGDLPVYESTRMDTIKISSATPITNGPFRN